MTKIIIEQSQTEDYTPHGGLALVGHLIRQSGIAREADLLPGSPSVSHSDTLKT